jgi:hypothetical protein
VLSFAQRTPSGTSEKDFDRKAAMETLKAIIVLGYSIQPVLGN